MFLELFTPWIPSPEVLNILWDTSIFMTGIIISVIAFAVAVKTSPEAKVDIQDIIPEKKETSYIINTTSNQQLNDYETYKALSL